jgi:hypothetical protein
LRTTDPYLLAIRIQLPTLEIVLRKRRTGINRRKPITRTTV